MQQFPVNADAPKGFIFGLSHFLYINNLSVNIIQNTSTNDKSSALYSKFVGAFDKLHKIELVFDLKSDFIDTMDWSRKRLIDFNAELVRLVSFNCPNNSGGKISCFYEVFFT